MFAANAFFGKSSVVAVASITYNAFTEVAISGTSTTVTGFNIGAAATGRIVAVFLTGGFGTASTILTVTIGGVSATKAIDYGSNQLRHGSIWYAVINTGTTANIVFTYATNTNSVFLSTASIYNAVSTTPVAGASYNSGTGVSPSRSVTLTPAANSVLFAGYSAGSIAAGTTSSWTNATEQTDFLTGSLYTDATNTGLPNTSLTVTATCTDSSVNRPGLVVATWA